MSSLVKSDKFIGVPFSGVPRDIDFIKNLGWTQVVVQSTGKDSLVSTTTNEQMQRILLVALMRKSDVIVEYVEDEPNQKKLISATLSVNAEDQPGQVFALSFAEKDNYYRATIFDQNDRVSVWTQTPQMQSILETAVRESIPVQEFSFDRDTMEITRGKVNVELGMTP
jgi:hypothetical protein